MKIQDSLRDEKIVGSPVKHFVKLAILMLVLWFLLSGRFELKFILYGVGTAVICGWICMPLMLVGSVDGTKKYFVFDFPVFRMLGYCCWLFVQLVLANLDIAKAVVSPTLGIDPKIVRFRVKMDNPAAMTVLANSITLTPGTVTMNVTDDGLYEIHALTPGAAEGICAGDMQRRVARLFGQNEEVILVEEGAEI